MRNLLAMDLLYDNFADNKFTAMNLPKIKTTLPLFGAEFVIIFQYPLDASNLKLGLKNIINKFFKAWFKWIWEGGWVAVS